MQAVVKFYDIFKFLGDFFTNFLFQPFEKIRFSENWWLQNAVNWLFVFIVLGFMIYWISRIINQQKKAKNPSQST